jgi:BirA family transcriptional regulator, biotin operon repressor / biotin---[acetyl-CoA-carboxylase] ligase
MHTHSQEGGHQPLTIEALQHGWSPRRVGRRIVTVDETESTNTLAMQLIDQPGADGLAILAERQRVGRGRLGATWLSPRGASVLCSVLICSSTDMQSEAAVDHEAQSGISAWLTQVSSVAVCEAIRRATGVYSAIKWPNDIRVNGKKLGGILIESKVLPDRRRGWVVGIGINCLQHKAHFPQELRHSATSLEMETSDPVDRMAVARELLMALDDWLVADKWGRTALAHSAWMLWAEPIGQRVALERDGQRYTGWSVDVDPAGGLIVRLESGQLEWFDPMRTRWL